MCLVVSVIVLCCVYCVFFLMIRRPPRSTLLTHSFPTRRSSDLLARCTQSRNVQVSAPSKRLTTTDSRSPGSKLRRFTPCRAPGSDSRSEEHTSELQSLMCISYAVFCLKKKTYNQRALATTNSKKYQDSIR